jgi:flagellar hook protein FlgE
MAFTQGLSGLKASATALDVTSNNVANAQTVGFKAGQAHFADAYANSLVGSGASQIGFGVTVPTIQQQFTQGAVTATNNPLDFAINGNGFFRMNENGSTSYTRNGQFHLDKNGYIVDDHARKLNGYMADATGKIITSAPVDLTIDTSAQPPVATGSSTATAGSTGVTANINLNASSVAPTTAWAITPPATVPTSAMYNYTTGTTVYDSLGDPLTMTIYAVKTAANTWDIYTSVEDTAGPVYAGPTPMTFLSDGTLDPTAPNGVIPMSTVLTTGAATPLAFQLDFTGTTQFNAVNGVNSLTQDGNAPGRLVGLAVSADGVIAGTYSNGKTRNLSQVALSNFTNPNGLVSLGGNQWRESATSGVSLTGVPNSGSLGALQNSAVEDSNVDLTVELVNMIVEQRNYQANAQTIKTQDTILQTLISMR